jgi:hypothetical protein
MSSCLPQVEIALVGCLRSLVDRGFDALAGWRDDDDPSGDKFWERMRLAQHLGMYAPGFWWR